MPAAAATGLQSREGQPAPPPAESLDMAGLLLEAYELGDWINNSAETADYLYWKNVVSADEAASKLSGKLAKAKERFAECERFGRFHPNYHEAKDALEDVQRELDGLESVSRFKAAERALDELLYEVSKTIAAAVSDSIKVPGNDPLPKSGCGGGGSCGCGSGGCG